MLPRGADSRQRAIEIDHADHDGALARSSAELTSHPENCGLTELAATPLARTTDPFHPPLLFHLTILPLCQPSRDYTPLHPQSTPFPRQEALRLPLSSTSTGPADPPAFCLANTLAALSPSPFFIPGTLSAPRAAGIPAASE